MFQALDSKRSKRGSAAGSGNQLRCDSAFPPAPRLRRDRSRRKGDILSNVWKSEEVAGVEESFGVEMGFELAHLFDAAFAEHNF